LGANFRCQVQEQHQTTFHDQIHNACTYMEKQVLNQVPSQVPSQFFLGNIDSWQALPSLQSTRVQVDITYVARCTRNRAMSV
jgi:hypothetical protein